MADDRGQMGPTPVELVFVLIAGLTAGLVAVELTDVIAFRLLFVAVAALVTGAVFEVTKRRLATAKSNGEHHG